MLLKYVPDKTPTPSPAINLPIVICVSEKVIPVCTAVPTVKTADQIRIDPLLPKRSEVNAWPRAPTNVLHNFIVGVQKKTKTLSPNRKIKKYTYPADKREVIMDWRELDRTNPPAPSGSPNRLTKSGMIKHPCGVCVQLPTTNIRRFAIKLTEITPIS